MSSALNSVFAFTSVSCTQHFKCLEQSQKKNVRALHSQFQTSLLWHGIQHASNSTTVPPIVIYSFTSNFFCLQAFHYYRPMFGERHADGSILIHGSFTQQFILNQLHYWENHFNSNKETWDWNKEDFRTDRKSMHQALPSTTSCRGVQFTGQGDRWQWQDMLPD